MKTKSSLLLHVITAFSLVVCIGSAIAAQSVAYPQEDKNKPDVSEAEAKAANAINSAPDAAAKLAAADQFVKKHPKSSLRVQIAGYVAGEIARVGDAAQKLALAESFQKVFTADKELETIQPVILDSYVGAKRVDEAFSLAASMLAKQPDNVAVLTQMAIAGTDEAKRQNPKYVTQSQQYGLKAIELIEANQKPANLNDAAWESQKTAVLPGIYQSMAILSLVSGKPAEAKIRLDKAIALSPSEPFNYVLIASIFNEEYQQAAQSYRSLPEGKPKEEALKKAIELLDRVIDLYARAIGAAEGKPEFQQLRDQILQDITPYYKYRHNQSTDGLQALIDKYKAPSKP